MNRACLFWLPILLLTGIVPAVLADGTSTPLTLDQAVAEALRANLTLQDASLKLGVKERDKNLALNKFWPTVTVGAALVSLNDTYTYTQMQAYNPLTYKNLYYTPNATSLFLQLNGQFVFSWAMVEAIRQTGIDYDNSKISYQMAAQRLERDVRKLFFQLLVVQEAIAVTEHQLAAAEERYQQALTNQKAGQSARLTVLQSKVAWENKKPGLEDLRVNYRQLLFGLEALLGRDPDPTLVLQGSLDVIPPPANLDAEAAVARFLDRRYDVQAAQGQLRAAQGALAIQWAQMLPTVGIQYAADPYINDPLSRSADYFLASDHWHQKNGAWTVFLNWKLDGLVPWSPSDNQRADTADLGLQAGVGIQGARLTARNEVMTLYTKIHKSSLALISLRDNVDSAFEAYKLTDEAYKAGVRSLLEVQDSEVQYQFAQVALLNEKQLLNASILDLETALNTPRSEIFALTKPQGDQ